MFGMLIEDNAMTWADRREVGRAKEIHRWGDIPVGQSIFASSTVVDVIKMRNNAYQWVARNPGTAIATRLIEGGLRVYRLS